MDIGTRLIGLKRQRDGAEALQQLQNSKHFNSGDESEAETLAPTQPGSTATTPGPSESPKRMHRTDTSDLNSEVDDSESQRGGNKNAWSEEEDNKLIELVRENGEQMWSKIAALMENRNGKQCRDRWHNHLCPEVKKEHWTPEEDRILFNAHEAHGNKWALIAKEFLPGRTDLSVKNRYYSAQRRYDRRTAKTRPGEDSNGEQDGAELKSISPSKRQLSTSSEPSVREAKKPMLHKPHPQPAMRTNSSTFKGSENKHHSLPIPAALTQDRRMSSFSTKSNVSTVSSSSSAHVGNFNNQNTVPNHPQHQQNQILQQLMLAMQQQQQPQQVQPQQVQPQQNMNPAQAIQGALLQVLQQQQQQQQMAKQGDGSDQVVKQVQMLQQYIQQQRDLLAQLENNKRMGDLIAAEAAKMNGQLSAGNPNLAAVASALALAQQQQQQQQLLNQNLLSGLLGSLGGAVASVPTSTSTSTSTSPHESPSLNPSYPPQLPGNFLLPGGLSIQKPQQQIPSGQFGMGGMKASALEALQQHLLNGLLSPNLQQVLTSHLGDPRSINGGYRSTSGDMDQGNHSSSLPRSYPNGRPISGALPGTENVGRWTQQEHDRFLEGLKKHGTKHWTAIANVVQTRTVVQVRTHAQKYFKKLEQEGRLPKGESGSLSDGASPAGTPGGESDDEDENTRDTEDTKND